MASPAFLLAGAPVTLLVPASAARGCLCTRRVAAGVPRRRSPFTPVCMAANVPPSPDGPPPAEDGNDADEAGGTDGGDGAATPPPSASSASSASESSLPPPLGDGESPPPLDYGALAARIAALPTADEVGGAVHRFDTIEPADAAGYAAAYRSAVSLFLLLVGGKGGAVGGAAGGRSGGVSGNDVYAIAVGRDRVALVFATRTDAIMYGRMMLGKAGSGGYRRVRVAVRWAVCNDGEGGGLGRASGLAVGVRSCAS